jgi:hypothetical protein
MAEGNVPQTAIDAPLGERAKLDAWVTTLPLDTVAEGEVRPAQSVVAAGRAARNAPGSRAVRAARDVAAADAGARANWIPTGPRNITGRVRALAAHPTDPTIMYAGSASGGVFKSVDGGETWSPSWAEDASSAIGGVSICRDHPEVVWAATGEIQAGGGESILGSGIYRSPDSGATWVNAATPHVQGSAPNLATSFDAIAAHPTNSSICWAVGPSGVFRTRDGGSNWSQYENGVYYSDVAFSVDTGGAPVVFLVRARSSLGEATVLRIDAPDDPSDLNVRAAIANPASASNPVAPVVAPPPPAQPQGAWPGRGKLAICSGTPSVAYLRLVTVGGGGTHLGLFRTQTAQTAPAGGVSGVVWQPIFDGVSAVPTDAGFTDDGQGTYDLALGVNPANPNELATGMLNVHVSLNANGANNQVIFKRAMAEDLTLIDRAQHGDQHTTLFVPPPAAAPAGTPPTLWVTNDGGISSSVDWRTGVSYARGQTLLPVPAGATTWRKSFGISASQMYSLSQSLLMPTVFGCGFQDNGVLFTSGGLTWRVVIGADGGFLTFDPDDPYKLLATWQRAIDEVLFPGKLEGGFALAGYPAREGIWPRQLSQGFLPTDGPLFVADTVHHPQRGDRVLHARRNRLYGSNESSGDRWQPEAAGRGFEIQLTAQPTVAVPNTAATIEVQPTPGSERLGLAAQVRMNFARQPTAAVAVVRNLRPGPYALQDNDTLNLLLTTTPPAVPPLAPATVTFVRSADKQGEPWTAAEVVAEIARQAPVSAYSCFWARPALVELTTTELGPGAQITLGGTALNPPPAPNDLAPLGLCARTYHGTANRPAAVTLQAPHVSMAAPAGQLPLVLTVQIGAGGATRSITFDADTFVDLSWIHAGELEQAIKAALHDDPATVTAVAAAKRLLISGTGGHSLQLGGTAAPQLNIFGWTAAAPPAPLLECNVAQANSFNLAPTAAAPGVALVLTINDGAVRPSLTFNGTANDLRALTSEELQALLNAHFTAHAIAAKCDLEFIFDDGAPSEIAYSQSAPDTAWVGSTDGTLYRTTNDGVRWATIQDPALYRLDRRVEAIAISPTDPNIVYVGLEGRPTSGVEDQALLTKPGLLFKTTDGGGSWDHVGADVKDAAGGLLGVYALQIDAAAADTVFAATEVGVFRSTDAGASWSPFNEGLPNGIVRDLDFIPARRVLRAGVWGRGTFERSVGGTQPKDVSIYVRSSLLDDGSTRPAPRGPDVYASVPRLVSATESPDVKVSRDDPPSIAGVTAIDGVEFDDDIVHEDPVAGPATVFVQVHNRGSFDGTSPRIVCLWADASAGPPPLPADFWTQFHAGPLAGTAGSWAVVHDTRADAAGTVRNVHPGYPIVQRLSGFSWPADVSTHRRVGILVLVECAEDPLTTTHLDVGELLQGEPKAAYRESSTVRDRDDQIVLIQPTSRAPFTASAPAAPLISADPVLFPAGLPGGPVSTLATPAQASFALPPAPPNNQALVFSVPPQTVTISFAAGIFNLTAATLGEVANVIRHALIAADAPVTLSGIVVGAGAGLRLNGVGGVLLQVTGGTAAANIGFAAAPPSPQIVGTVAAPFALNVGAPQTLVLSVTKQATVQFASQPGFNPAAAPPRALRRLLNREFAAAHLPIRAVSPRVDLWIRRSITDIDGIPSPVAGRQLADLVAAPAAVPAANQAALFDLVKAHGGAPVKPSADNFVYVRVANLGNVDLAAADSRHRLYALAITASPITVTQVGAAAGIQQIVPGGSSAIVEFDWNPGAVATGDRLFVLAVSDDQTNQPVAVPGTFATVDLLDVFCSSNPNAAYRMFVVGT